MKIRYRQDIINLRSTRFSFKIDRLYNADDFCALMLLALSWIDCPSRGYLGQETQFAE